MTYYKRYVDVVVLVDKHAEMTPLFLIFDTKKYAIDRVLQIKKTSSVVGGSGVLYRCRIQNQERNLFLERNRWFIESLKP